MNDSLAPLVRNVSNSEVTAFLSCKRMYRYAFTYNLEPKDRSKMYALDRGTLGHLAFEVYITIRLEGGSHAQALKAVREMFMRELASGSASIELVNEVRFLWERYMQFHDGWPDWNLLGTEQRLDLKLTDTLSFPIRYDLYIEEKRTGRRLIGDFKFTYDFWSPEDHELNGQMPKYIAVLRANGFRCDGGFLEEVRTRPLGKEKSADRKNLWRRTTYVPSIAKQQSVLRQHVAASLEIESFRALSEEEQRKHAIPVLNKHGACKYCNFKSLCNSENEGKKDLTPDMSIDYQENTYGYNKPEDLRKLEDLI